MPGFIESLGDTPPSAPLTLEALESAMREVWDMVGPDQPHMIVVHPRTVRYVRAPR